MERLPSSFLSFRRAFVVAALTAACAAAASSTTADAATSRPPAPRAGTPVDVPGAIVSGGLTRTFLMHTPPGLASGTRVPLLLVFHGNGGTAADVAAVTGYDRIADANNFIVVYPQGVADSWNDGRGTTEAEIDGVDDVGFVHNLVLSLESSAPVDPHRVYAVGFSNGAMLTERLGCALTSTFAAIAVVAGPIPTPLAPVCAPSRPIPVLAIQGTSDAVVPYGGGTVTSAVGGSVLSASATVSFWAQHDGCPGPTSLGTRPAAPNDGTGVSVTGYGACRGGSRVVLVNVIGGGHQWPGALSGVGSTPAVPGASFRASPVIWRFLRQFVRHHPGS